MSEGEYYNIEKILDRRKTGGKFEYKIKWEGYPMSESTWEPMKNLETAKELVEEYNRTHPIANSQKPVKTETTKKADSFIRKKRKEEDEEKSQQNSQDEKNPEDEVKKIDNNVIPFITNNENVIANVNEKTYFIDDSLKSVFTVKQQNQKLMAVVEKLNDDGNVEKVYIPTEELRRTNPWILLNFYESKIKFT
jgi:hypothetical protein